MDAYKTCEYSEILVNNSKLKNLYHIYLHQSIFEKILDTLVVFAIIFTIVEVTTHIFFHLPKEVLQAFQSLTVLIFFIFGLELFREYAKSRSHKHFFRKHGLDFVLVVFLSFYFFSATYFGIARIRYIVNIGEYATKLKQLKIVSKIGSLRKSI